MLRVFLTITLIVAVGVSAHRKGCRDDTDPECQCKKLLKPEGGKDEFKNIVKTCAQEAGVTLPEKPERGGGGGGGRGRPGRGKRHPPPEKFLESLPEAVRICIQEQILENARALGDDGILETELNDHIVQNIDTNRAEVTITDDQYNTITTAIPQCITDNPEVLFDIFKCVKDSCTAALT